MNKKRKLPAIIANVLLYGVIALALIACAKAYVANKNGEIPSFLGVSIFDIQTKSMIPTFDEGDLIVDVTVKDPTTLKEKDIITFYAWINGGKKLNSHRILRVVNSEEGLYFITKGDNNSRADDTPVYPEDIVGKYVFTVKGNFADFAKQNGVYILIAALVLIFAVTFITSGRKNNEEKNSSKKSEENN